MANGTKNETLLYRRKIRLNTLPRRCRPLIGLVLYIQLVIFSFCLADSPQCPSIDDNTKWRKNLYSLPESCGPNGTIVISNWLNDLKHYLNEPNDAYYKKNINVDVSSRIIPSTLTHVRFEKAQYSSRNLIKNNSETIFPSYDYSREVFLPTYEVFELSLKFMHDLWILSSPRYNTMKRQKSTTETLKRTDYSSLWLPYNMKYGIKYDELELSTAYPLHYKSISWGFYKPAEYNASGEPHMGSLKTWATLSLLTNSIVLLTAYKNQNSIRVLDPEFVIPFYLYRNFSMDAQNVIIIPEKKIWTEPISVEDIMAKLRAELTAEEFQRSFGPVVTHYFYYFSGIKLKTRNLDRQKLKHTILGVDAPAKTPAFLARAPQAEVFDFSSRYTSQFMYNFLYEAFNEKDPKSNKLKDMVIYYDEITSPNNEIKKKFGPNLAKNITLLWTTSKNNTNELNEVRKQTTDKLTALTSTVDSQGIKINKVDRSLWLLSEKVDLLNKTLLAINITQSLRNLSDQPVKSLFDISPQLQATIREVVIEEKQSEMQKSKRTINETLPITYGRSLAIPYRNIVDTDGWDNIIKEEKVKTTEPSFKQEISYDEYQRMINRSEMGIETVKWGHAYTFDNSFNQIFIFMKPKLESLISNPIDYSCGEEYSQHLKAQILCNLRFQSKTCPCSTIECCVDNSTCSYGPNEEEQQVLNDLESVYTFCKQVQKHLKDRNTEVEKIQKRRMDKNRYSLAPHRERRFILLTAVIIAGIMSLVGTGVGIYATYKANEANSLAENVRKETRTEIDNMLKKLNEYNERFQASQTQLLAIQRIFNNETSKNTAMITGMTHTSNITISILNQVRTSQVFLAKKTAAVTEVMSHLISSIALSQTKDLELSASLGEINIWQRAGILLKKGFLPIELLPKAILRQTLSKVKQTLETRPFKLALNHDEIEKYYSLPLTSSVEDEEKIIVKLSIPLLQRNNTLNQPLKLMRFRSKWIPCPQNSCEGNHFMKLKEITSLQVAHGGQPLAINPADLTCSMEGDKRVCLSFTPGIIYNPDACIQAIIKWNLEMIKSKCEFTTQTNDLINYTPIQVTKDTFTVHRDGVLNGQIILEETENEPGLIHKSYLNVTSYCAQLKVSSSGKIYDDSLNWIKTNTDPINDGDGWLIKRSNTFEHNTTPNVFKAITLHELIRTIKEENVSNPNVSDPLHEARKNLNDVFKLLSYEKPNASAEIEKFEKIITNQTYNGYTSQYGINIPNYLLTLIERVLRIMARIPGWVTTLSLLILAFKMNRFGFREAQIILLLDGKTIELVHAQSLYMSVRIPYLQLLETTTNLIYLLLIIVIIYYGYKRGIRRQVIVNHFEGEILPTHNKDFNRFWMGRLTFNIKRSTICNELNQKIVLWFPLNTTTENSWKHAVVSPPKSFIYSRPSTNTWHIASPVFVRFFDENGLVCYDSTSTEAGRFDIIKIKWYTNKRPRGMFYPFLEECTIDILRDGRAHYPDRESQL